VLTVILLSFYFFCAFLGYDLREIRKSLRETAESLRNIERILESK
jgi:uncharacterized protein YoxC